ncbi:MAG TPA: DUF3267 domain-containing protein [Leptolinea sp.]
MQKNKRAMLILNGVGFVIFIASAILLRFYVQLVRPQDTAGLSGSIQGFAEMLWIIFLLLLDIILLIILHEGVHGICFWLITGKRPLFSIGPGYASAAAPRSLISRKPYLVTALSPLVVLTVIGLILIPVASPGWLFYLELFIVMNISGAVGDLWVAGTIFPRSEPLLVQDFGDQVLVFQPEKKTAL